MRPTGKLHLGNYMGALKNWVDLQHQYECYFFIADYHALTTDYADTSQLKQNVYEVALDFLSAGLNPDLCTIFVQSHVPQHAELNVILSMMTPLSWLERVPTYKDQQEQLREKDLATYGFLGYPLLQTADILAYQPRFVPVGQDQVAHVEITREIARRFNLLYGPKSADIAGNYERAISDKDKLKALEAHPRTYAGILPEPEILLTPSPKLPGTDGRKMSKSYGNTILLSDLPGDVHVKLQGMSKAGQRPTQDTPGDPTICPVGDLHRVFSAAHVLDHISQGCTTATIRCDECKFLAANGINSHLQPIRHRRDELESNPDVVWDTLGQGALRAAARADQTMQLVRAATGLSRDRSGVRLPRTLLNQQDRDPRNLDALRDWWNAEPAILSRNLRTLWRQDLVPTEIALKQDSEGLWVTLNGRRVFVAVAVENPEEEAWQFSLKPKTYEFLVLLCWANDGKLHDFVVPQNFYLGQWTTAKKRGGKENIFFSVERTGDRYLMQLPHFDPIDITGTEAGYGILRG
jgi:tryptophanyl-tRNA synthetase